jgi:phosphate transport system substrate-binding protein
MEPSAMNDEFLRHLRPRPRAAFVHQLKSRLDRLPRTRPRVSGPAYLRTLLIALVIGGAAFAVTMLSRRHEPVVARVGASVSQARPLSDEVPKIASSPLPARSRENELTPAIVHAARRDGAPREGAVATDPPQRPADGRGVASDVPVVVEASVSQALAGIAIAGEGVHSIRGAGGKFPLEIYDEWGRQYLRANKVSVAYEWMGSGGGVKLLQNRAITFAAVDVPMQGAELKASGMFQFPMVAGGVVPIVHLAGVKPSQIWLDAPTLARIYLGEISLWSDPPIAKLNPNVALPGTRITLAYRMDGSLTTQFFTDYLSKWSPWFKSRYGGRSQIDVSPGAAARGDDGMADLVQRTDGAIGYLDYGYAKLHGIESIRLINKEGKAVAATPESLESAILHADWLGTPGFGASLMDLPGEQTWPMSSASFIVMRAPIDQYQTAAAVQFFDWAYRNGSQTATELGYVAIPPIVANHVRASWAAAVSKGPPPDSGGK